MNTFREMMQYKELLKTNVKKDIRGRYKGSVLGILWSFLNPLLQVLVYYLVFPYLMRSTMPNYLVYLITGLLPWMFFQQTLNDGCRCIRANAGIIKKVYFPRQILVLSQVISGLINFLITIPIILIFVLIFRVEMTPYILWSIPVALLEAFLLYGLISIACAISVYMTDIEYIIQFILNMLFYGTPILYAMDLIPDMSFLGVLVTWNPMTVLILAYRDALMYGQMPDLFMLGYVVALSVLVFLIGQLVFRKLEKGFAEEL